MCTLCNPVNHVILSELERMVVLAEAEAGLGDTAAHRPLSGPEKASGVRFSEIAALEEDYLATVAPILERLREVVGEEITAALAGITTGAALVDALEALTVGQPARVTEAVAQATLSVSEALAATYTGASETVIREAERQGVTRLPEPREADPERFRAVAKTASLEPWKRALTVVQDRVASPSVLASPVLDQDLLPMALADIDGAGALDQARQAAHGAINTGRFDTAEQLPFESAWSSEILDSSTCSNCRDEDQKEYATLDEVRAAYPNGGGFRDCLGGSRCRGTAVFVYSRS